jgi:ribosomal protein S18 acetylase RimI-like enzyme
MWLPSDYPPGSDGHSADRAGLTLGQMGWFFSVLRIARQNTRSDLSWSALRGVSFYTAIYSNAVQRADTDGLVRNRRRSFTRPKTIILRFRTVKSKNCARRLDWREGIAAKGTQVIRATISALDTLHMAGLCGMLGVMLIRSAGHDDQCAIWAIIGPTIRAGETYALDRDLSKADALAYWMGADRDTFVAEEGGLILGTYYIRANQAGGGRHVCNCGYMTDATATGRGVAREMCKHSLENARSKGFRAMQFNFVLSTNERAVRLWQSLGFEIVGRLPEAFLHPAHGYVDALVMFQTL